MLKTSLEVFWIFLRLGLSSFGGPIAHLGYFRDEFVTRRCWLTEQSYADIVALCQFLPGPASSQTGMALGILRAGLPGAIAAWLGFTLPSAIAMLLFAVGIRHFNIAHSALHGLKIVAVTVVAQAIWSMAKSLCTNRVTVTISVGTACLSLLIPGTITQLSSLCLAAGFGLIFCKLPQLKQTEPLYIPIKRHIALISLGLFCLLLLGLPILQSIWPNQSLKEIDVFYRAGSLVFGGGHVVLPLLQAELVTNNWLSNETFLAGYGAAQAVPGPLFTFAAFLGAAMSDTNPWLSGMICLLAIFLPSFLLVFAALPYWVELRAQPLAQAALVGINASVVGLLLAAFYQPVWTSAILTSKDFSLAILAYVALVFWKLPAWLVVFANGLLAWLLL